MPQGDPKPEAPDLAELRRQEPERCDRCGWTLKERLEDGCVPGNCSERPLPPERKAFARAEYIAMRDERDDARRQLETLRARVAELDAALDLAARRFGRMGFTVWAYETRSAAAAALGREPAETLCVKSANHLSDCEFRSITRAEMQLGAPRCLRRGEPGNEPQGAGSPQQPAERKKEEG